MYINYFKADRSAFNLFETLKESDYSKVGNSFEYMDYCWGEQYINCIYNFFDRGAVTNFFNSNNKRIGYPVFGQFEVYERKGHIKNCLLAAGDGEKIVINSNYAQMMPKLRRYPETIEEYFGLIAVDPRYLLHIQNEVLVDAFKNNNTLFKDITKITELAVCRILCNNEHNKFNTQEEYKIRERYKKEVDNSLRNLGRELKRALRRENIKLDEKLF